MSDRGFFLEGTGQTHLDSRGLFQAYRIENDILPHINFYDFLKSDVWQYISCEMEN